MISRLLRFGYPWMIVWVCFVHLTIGAGLLLRPSTENLLIISGLNRFLELPIADRHVLAGVLMMGALLALVGVALEGTAKPRICLALLIWQYGFVVGGTLSSLIILFTGFQNAAGVEIDRITILVVLCYSLYAGIFHTLSILERFVIEPRREAG